MTAWTYHANSEADTQRLGAALATIVPAGTTISLTGTLGAGKTRFVQAFAQALQVPQESVVSPTFVLCQEYHGQHVIYHLDAYRIADDDEFLELGTEEYFESDGISLVEWGDRVANCLPTDRMNIEINVTGATARQFVVRALGDYPADVIHRLAEELTSDAS